MQTTRPRIVYVHSAGHAEAIMLGWSVGTAFGALIGLTARFLVAGSAAVVAALRGL